MKRLLFFCCILSAFAFRPETSGSNPAVIKFDEVKHNFGFIHQGEIVSHDFSFINTGDEPVIIQDAEVNCKCTTVDFPKNPILKGQKGIVKITYDSKSAMDRQERTAIIKSNASNSQVTLTFKCVVLKPKN